MTSARSAATGALLVLPGLLTVYLGFNAGGFYPASVGVVAAVLAVALVLRLGGARHPLEGIGAPGAAVAAALALFAIWTLASSFWSDSTARAILEFDRALVYLLAFVLLATVRWTPRRAWLAAAGLGVAFVAIAGGGFLSRVAPDLVAGGAGPVSGRLSYPLTYWNAQGLACALGLVFCIHLGSVNRSSLAWRTLFLAATPMLAATLLLTFSRGAFAAAAIGVLAYAVAARARGVFAAVCAAAPGVILSVREAYQADLLSTADFAGAVAQDQADRLVTIVALATVLTVVLRVGFGMVEGRMGEMRRPRARWAAPAGLAMTVAVAAIAVFALGGAREIDSQWQRFKAAEPTTAPRKQRDRLTDVNNNGRLALWKVADRAFADHRLVGTGAGTFQLQWAERRPGTVVVSDAHSLPLETASELGLVGVVLLGCAVLGLLGAAVARARGPDRALAALVIGAGVAWLARASIDWDWEMPAVTMWFFALGGLALARREPASGDGPATLPRVVGMLICLVLAVLPLQVTVSQNRLDAAVDAFRRGDCRQAVTRSIEASKAVPSRPEPLQVLALCDVRLGRGALAQELAERAVARDPGNWEFHYTLALVRGAFGRDPRPAARRALALNPRERLTRDAARRFRTSDPRRWAAVARSAPLPFQ